MRIIPKFQRGKVVTRKVSLSEAAANKRKQRFLNANGVKVKIDGSWGPWQQEQYERLLSPERLNTADNTVSQDNTVVMDHPHRKINPHLEKKAVEGAKAHAAWEKDNPALAKFSYVAGAAPFIAMAAPFAWEALPYMSSSFLLGNAGRMVAGNIGAEVGGAVGTAADLGLAGVSAYDGAKRLFSSDSDMFDRTVGAGEAVGVFPLIKTFGNGLKAARASFADNIVPIGYNNRKQEIYPKGKLIWEFTKGTFERLSRPKEFVSSNPKWAKRVDPREFDGLNKTEVSGEQNIKYRLDAVNLAMRLPQQNNTYLSNGDGTYMYNPEKVRSPIISMLVKNVDQNGHTVTEKVFNGNLLRELKEGESVLAGDIMAGNGGYGMITKENGKLYFIDRWDVHPFRDEYRAPLGKFGKFMHKVAPNLEVVGLLRGNKFILKQPLRTQIGHGQ